METLEHKRERQRNWVSSRRLEYISKRGGCCRVCGSVEALEFHHRDPTMKVSHRIFSWKRSRIDVELEKCDLLCSKCHRQETNKFFGFPTHGTNYTYKVKKCRCELCICAYRQKKRFEGRRRYARLKLRTSTLG
jgi:5-methylcytosine-specific restriction endonuclease McrA